MKNHKAIAAVILLIVIFSIGLAAKYIAAYNRTIGQWELLAKADIDRDGKDEAIYLDKTQINSASCVMLHILNSKGDEVWNQSVGTSHAWWGSYFLCHRNDDYYLLRYDPGMWQGYCTYIYTLFTLENGKEKAFRSNQLDFDINGIKKLDAPKMLAFAEEVNSLLDKSILLLSSEGGSYTFGPSSTEKFIERYSWLDATPWLYESNDDLETRLNKYSDAAFVNHPK